jgi:hypothetical protein
MITFQLLGRSKQPQIQNSNDLLGLLDLDDALWVATAAPCVAFRLDPVFLAHVDADGDGRIRSDEVRGAIRWAFANLKDKTSVRSGNDALLLSSVDPAGPEGAAVLDGARRILGDLGQPGASTVSLAQVRAVRAAEEARGLSAAGRVLPTAAGDDAALSAFLQHVVDVTGGEPHPLGGAAVTAATLDRFLAEAGAWLTWHDKGQIQDGNVVQPLGEGSGHALAATEAVAGKLDQYFLLCDAVRLDAALADRARVDASGTDLLDTQAATALLERAPIAPPSADGVLRLDGVINPAWRARLEAFEASVRPLLPAGRTLDRTGYAAVRAALAPHAAWLGEKPQSKAGNGDIETLRQHHGTAQLHERARSLLANSEVAAVALDGVKLVEKLILLQANLLPLVRNFACLPDLYNPKARSLVERGRVVFDGRVFDLALPVTDAGRAERYAAMSPLFVMFIKVGEKGGDMSEEWAVPVTAGEREHLVEGQWGIAIDVDGKELHAQIRKIVVSPISVREALLSPFRRIGDTVQSMFDKAAASQQSGMDASITARAQTAVDTTASAPTQLVAQGEASQAADAAPAPPAAPAAPPAPASGALGQLPLILAGAGVALAAVGAAALEVLKMVGAATSSLAAWLDALVPAEMPAGASYALHAVAAPVAVVLMVIGIALVPLLAYALPITIATWLRLRRRDLSTLLEGAGWAVNTRLFLDRTLAVQLTRRPPSA